MAPGCQLVLFNHDLADNILISQTKTCWLGWFDISVLFYCDINSVFHLLSLSTFIVLFF